LFVSVIFFECRFDHAALDVFDHFVDGFAVEGERFFRLSASAGSRGRSR
jgi:hypothetical protein